MAETHCAVGRFTEIGPETIVIAPVYLYLSNPGLGDESAV